MKNYTKSNLIKILAIITVFGSFLFSPTIARAEVGGNLVLNPSLETSSVDPSIPLNWNKGYSDPSDVVTYTYPVTDAPVSDISSGNAAKIEATSFVSGGDAKWYFDPVSVTPLHQYNFSDSYIANVSTNISAAFCEDASQHNCVYDTSHSVIATPNNIWEQSSVVFTVPAGKTYMTVFHNINMAGVLTIDNYNLTPVSLPAPFPYGFVTLSFDDGLSSQYENALPKLIAGNIKGVFFIVSHFISGLSISNPSVEIGISDNPTDWAHDGSLSATYTYSSDAHSGTKAVSVNSGVLNSNAGWYFKPITIIPDSIYNFSEFYKSTANSEIIAQITTNNDVTQTVDITNSIGGYVSDSVLLSSSPTYTEVSGFFYVPENAKSVTILNRLTGIGSLTVDDVKLGRVGHMTSTQVLDLEDKGNEVSGHTQTHPDLTTLNDSELSNEVNGGRNELLENSIIPAVSFAYPFGAFNGNVQQKVGDSGYGSGRTVIPGFNGMNTPRFALFSQSVNANTTLPEVKSWIDTAKADKTWLILTFHDIQDNLIDSPYGTTPENLSEIISYLNTQSVPVKTITEGVELMGYTPPPTDICPNVTGVQTTSPCVDSLCLSPNTWNVGTQTCDAPVIVIPPTDICPNVTGLQTEGPCADSLCLSPNTWNATAQTCDAPVVIITPPSQQISSSQSSGGYLPKVAQSLNKVTEGKVLGVDKYVFTKWLKLGSRGTEVMELQKFLNNAGYNCGLVDGYFGLLTKNALIKFQIANGLMADGVVGPKTRELLNK